MHSCTSVQLVIVYGDAVRHMLGTFKSTNMFNFATWEGMYSLFPFSTFYSDYVGNLSVSTFDEMYLYLGELHGSRAVGDRWTYRESFSLDRCEVDDQLNRLSFRVVEGCIRFDGDGI